MNGDPLGFAGRSVLRRHRGLATVELALVLPILLLLIFAILDFGRLIYTQTTLQHAMREGGRYGVTGQRLPNPSDPHNLQSRLQSIKQIVHDSAVGVSVNMSDIVISSALGGNDNAGGPGDTLTISLTYEFHFATPLIGRYFNNGSYRFTTSTSFRNEPFPPSAGT